jgi:hypothetical protein
MGVVKGGRGKNAVEVDVQLYGFFFTGNPIGRLHLNVYSILREEGLVGVNIAKSALAGKQRQHGGGGISGISFSDVILANNITAQPMRMKRGRAKLVVSGTYGHQPYARYYNRWIDDASTNRPRGGFRGYRIYREAARAVQSHINGRIGPISRKLVEGLT